MIDLSHLTTPELYSLIDQVRREIRERHENLETLPSARKRAAKALKATKRNNHARPDTE